MFRSMRCDFRMVVDPDSSFVNQRHSDAAQPHELSSAQITLSMRMAATAPGPINQRPLHVSCLMLKPERAWLQP